MFQRLEKWKDRLRYQLPARLFPSLARLMLNYATKGASKALSESGPIKILLDDTVLDVAITHETKWITTSVQQIGGYEHLSGHLARVPVHGIDNDSDRYREATFLTGNPLFKGIAEPVGIVTAVAQQPVCFGQTIQQGCRSSVIADLPRRHEEADGAAPGIRHSVKLRIHAAFRAPDQSARTPLFTRRLEAVRCALR